MSVYQDRLRAVRLRTQSQALRAFDAITDHRDPLPFARQMVPLVASGQLTAAKITAGHVASTIKTPPVRPTIATVTGPAARHGVLLIDEYQRPFETIYGALAEGRSYTEAVALGRVRLSQLTVADVWLASRSAMQLAQDANPTIRGWVRVADATACDLCLAADGTPTSAAADIAFHVGCGCTADPTTDAPDSEPVNPDAIEVHEDDEFGPVLTHPGQTFSTV